MTIDIEKLIEEIDEDGSGEIEFDEFQALLQSESWALIFLYLLVSCMMRMFSAWDDYKLMFFLLFWGIQIGTVLKKLIN